MTRSRWGSAAVVAALLAVAALAGGGRVPSSAAAGPSTFTQAADQITTFNPFISYYDSELYVIGAIYPSLDIVQPDGTVKPYLADSWSTSTDKLTWTFHLHPGLKWSDGQPLTAKDAAWTFTTIMTNQIAATANGSLVQNFASATATDDTTLVIRTKKPQSNMLNISTPFTGIQVLPQHVWASKVGGDLKSFRNTPDKGKVVGYGPYTLTDYKTDQYTTISASDGFFGGRPQFDRMVFRYFKSSDAAVQALQTGEIDQLSGPTATQFEALKKRKGMTAYQMQAVHWAGIEINPGATDRDGKPLKTNTGSPVLANQRFRDAIAYSVDRQTLVDKVINGLGQPAYAYLPPAFPQWKWAPSDSQRMAYDPAKANAILDSLGYHRGSDGVRVDPKTGKKLALRLGTHSDDSNDTAIAGYLVGWLKAIGITLTIEPQSFSELNATLATGDYDLQMDGWSTSADPTYLLSIQTCAVRPDAAGTGGNTDSFFCDKDYDRLFALQQTQFDVAQRARSIAAMQEILYKANVDVMFYNDNGRTVVNTDKVKNYISGTPDSHGTMPLQNSFAQLLNAAPTTSRSGGGGGLGTGSIVGVAAAVVVVVAITLALLRRRHTPSDERE